MTRPCRVALILLYANQRNDATVAHGEADKRARLFFVPAEQWINVAVDPYTANMSKMKMATRRVIFRAAPPPDRTLFKHRVRQCVATSKNPLLPEIERQEKLGKELWSGLMRLFYETGYL